MICNINPPYSENVYGRTIRRTIQRKYRNAAAPEFGQNLFPDWFLGRSLPFSSAWSAQPLAKISYSYSYRHSCCRKAGNICRLSLTMGMVGHDRMTPYLNILKILRYINIIPNNWIVDSHSWTWYLQYRMCASNTIFLSYLLPFTTLCPLFVSFFLSLYLFKRLR